MRPTVSTLILVGFLVAACGGAAAPTQAPDGAAAPTQPPAGATPAPGQPTLAPGVATPAPPPPVGGSVASVVLTGGADAGTYTGGESPNCSFGLAREGSWGTQYSTETAGAGQLSSIQMIIPPADGGTFTMLVTIGPLFSGNNYEITAVGGTGSAQVTDNGATAVIHATGTTEDGVGMDVTVNCPSVIRM